MGQFRDAARLVDEPPVSAGWTRRPIDQRDQMTAKQGVRSVSVAELVGLGIGFRKRDMGQSHGPVRLVFHAGLPRPDGCAVGIAIRQIV